MIDVGISAIDGCHSLDNLLKITLNPSQEYQLDSFGLGIEEERNVEQMTHSSHH